MAIKCIAAAFNGVLSTVILAVIDGILIGGEMLIPHQNIVNFMGFKHCDPPCYQWDFNGILIGVKMLIPHKNPINLMRISTLAKLFESA